jgi:hypothetical protein
MTSNHSGPKSKIPLRGAVAKPLWPLSSDEPRLCSQDSPRAVTVARTCASALTRGRGASSMACTSRLFSTIASRTLAISARAACVAFFSSA